MTARARVALLSVALLWSVELALLALAPRGGGGVDPIALGVTLDLTLTSTLIVWWIAVRRRAAPHWILGAVFAAGVALSATVLPSDQRILALVLAGAWACVETAILMLVTVRIRRVVALVREQRRRGAPLGTAIEGALVSVTRMPRRIAAWLVLELTLLAYAFAGWFLRPPRAGFSMHRRSHVAALSGVLLFLLAVETMTVHVFVASASPVAAWVLTGLSIYGALWILGDTHALRLARITVDADLVRIEVGLRWRAEIPRSDIAAVEPYREAGGAIDLSIAGTRDVTLALRTPHRVRGPFGIVREARAIVLSVDDVDGFVRALAVSS